MKKLTRGNLKAVYDSLSGYEKSEWANNANYSSYQGLYRYLKDNQNSIAFPRIINALIKTIGKEKFNLLFPQIEVDGDTPEVSIDNILKNILFFIDNGTLEEMQQLKEILNTSSDIFSSKIFILENTEKLKAI